MIQEHERAVLTADLDDLGLCAGDVGTVIHVYPEAAAYEIEFFTLDGNTFAVATVEATKVRPVDVREMTHARQIES